MNPREYQNEFEENYNRFVRHYNGGGLSAFAELTTIREGYRQRIEELDNQISSHFEALQYKIESTNEEPLVGDVSNRQLIEHARRQEPCTEAKKTVKEQITQEQRTRSVIRNPKAVQKRLSMLATDFFNTYCDEAEAKSRADGFDAFVKILIRLGKKQQKTSIHNNAIKAVIDKIIETNYPADDLKHYQELSEREQKEVKEDFIYEPHHNTREGLVDDLKEIIKEIQQKIRNSKLNKSEYFHVDGNIKHTNVAGYATEQKWFTDRHGDGAAGLHRHIKGIWKELTVDKK